MINIGRWVARRRAGRVAVAVLLANELEQGDLRERIMKCLADRDADPVIRKAVDRELRRFRRTADRGMKLAQLSELVDAEKHGTTPFFELIELADKRAERLLR
ncbi:hypothetical protein H3146_24805 [Streptomyces sp. OF3]|uniref:Uncharacterized protein n=1 Tax=Streptomyces alkaliterrae TaxID=2213162 RepID=A0A7W3WQF5_9ACTN|nr:hypothetical protein [Streptomyces alkaliterrae]MBB1256544.1 hypothetical protein [Streptomyces alkaliterrae]